MPRCYMVKTGRRYYESAWPYSPSEGSVAVSCYSPTEDTPEHAPSPHAPTTEHTAADTEAAHELLSLAQGVSGRHPIRDISTQYVIGLQPPEPLYPYIQPTNVEYHPVPPDDLYPKLPDSNYITLQPRAASISTETDPPPAPPPAPAPGPTSPTLTMPLSLSKSERGGRYVCTECGKSYATSSNLSRHRQTHRSLDSLAAKRCQECGKVYVSMPALSMHILTHRMGHTCAVCGKHFSRPWLLRGHQRSHTGEKPYRCPHCHKAFADRSNLRAHLQTHSTDRKYECERCRKTFVLKSYLVKHHEVSCVRSGAVTVGGGEE